MERVHGLAVGVAAHEHVPDPVHGAPFKVDGEGGEGSAERIISFISIEEERLG